MKNLLHSINALKRKWLIFAAALMVSVNIYSQPLQIDELQFSTSNPIWDATFLNTLTWPQSWGDWDPISQTLTMNQGISVQRTGSSTRIEFVIDGITVEFPAGNGIMVQQGESLTINGAIIKADGASIHWSGITAFGIKSEEQFDYSAVGSVPPIEVPKDATTTYNSEQTFLKIVNSTIQLAQNGAFSTDGAILICETSTFTDCEVSVGIADYITPTNVSAPDIEYRNASYISDCTFEWWNVIAFNTGLNHFGTRKAIFLDGVQGIHLQGVRIYNRNQTYKKCEYRGTGIKTLDAMFTIHESGTPGTKDAFGCFTYSGGRDNVIEETSFGITIEESPTYTAYRSNATMWDLRLGNVPFGVYMEGGEKIALRECQFNMEYIDSYIDNTISACSTAYYGLYVLATEMVMVADCQFKGKPLALNPDPVTFIKLDNCGSKDNKIYHNTFEVSTPDNSGNDFIGVALFRNNSRIEVGCNDFKSIKFGIEVDINANVGTAWTNDFQTPDHVMSNAFSGTRVVDLKNNSTTVINYREYNDIWVDNPLGGNPILRNSPSLWNRTGPTTVPQNATCNNVPCNALPIGVSVGEPLELNNITVYPNPATDRININFVNSFTGIIVITDILGRDVKSLIIDDLFETVVDVSNLPSAMYIVRCIGVRQEVYSKKILVNTDN